MNEEKDRFGDLMRLVERAREDIYFSSLDRQLIERIRAGLHKDETAQLEINFLLCPRCGTELHNSTMMDLSVNHCSGCGGIWLDRDGLSEFRMLNNVELPERRRSFG